MRKTDADIKYERAAHELNASLGGTGLHVTGGGRNGPYTLTVERLGWKRLNAVIEAVRRAMEEGTS